MPFSASTSSSFNPAAAASLNALASLVSKSPDDNHWLSRRFTEPEGTMLEAELLLSPSGMHRSAIGRAIMLKKDKVSAKFSELWNLFPVAPTNTTTTTIITTNHETHLIHAFMRLRGTIQVVVSSSDETGEKEEVFSNMLFGPDIARVLNALLALESSCVTNDSRERLLLSPHHASKLDEIESDDPSLVVRGRKRPLFTTLQGKNNKGTAFAAEWLVMQYMYNQGEYALSIRHNHFGLRDALFPRFGGGELQEEGMPFNAACQMAMQQIHKEMHHISTVVDRRFVPLLMGTHARLGRDSPLRGVNDEILRLVLLLQ